MSTCRQESGFLAAFSFLGGFIMIKMLMPVFLVVFSNVFYNLAAKFTPARANAFLSLSVTYITAALCSFLAFALTSNGDGFIKELSRLNLSSLVLGLSIIGLEIGYIFIYRVGWKIGVGSLVANILLASVLLFVGFFFFKESISLRQILGVLLCLFGLCLISK